MVELYSKQESCNRIMPRPTKCGDQWKECDRCGILTPMSRLLLMDELILCDRAGCRDTIDKEIHIRLVGQLLAAPTREGEDRRSDLYFLGETDVYD